MIFGGSASLNERSARNTKNMLGSVAAEALGCHRSEHAAAADGRHGEQRFSRRAADLSDEALGNESCQKRLAYGEAIVH